MKRRTFWGLLAFLMVISMVLASCNSSTTTSTPATTTTTTSISTTATSTTAITQTSTTSTAVVTTTATTTSTGNWWDSLGTPQYGGTFTFTISNDILSWDPYLGTIPVAGYYEYLEDSFH